MEKLIYGYIRESTREQALNGFNIDTQEKKIKEYINLYDIKGTLKILVDGGVSAKTIDRPKLNKLKENVIAGKVDTVIVYKIDRLVRRLKGLNELVELFNQYGVRLISVNEKVDTTSANGRFFLNAITMIAEWEQDTISERTNDGLTEGAEQGFFMLGQTPFGYEKYDVANHKMLRVVDEQKRVIRKMADLLKKGYSIYSIKIMIDNDTYMKSINRTYCENQIINILKSKINIGIMNFKNKDYKLKMNTIFSHDEYEEILKLLCERSKNTKYKYLFERKVKSIDGSFSKIQSTVKQNGVYLYYYDLETKKRVNEIQIKQDVIEYLKESNILYKNVRNRTFKADVAHLEKKMNEVERIYKNCLITTEMYKEEQMKLKKENAKIIECKNKYIDNLNSYFNSLNFNDQSKIIWKCINFIQIDFTKKDIIKIC